MGGGGASPVPPGRSVETRGDWAQLFSAALDTKRTEGLGKVGKCFAAEPHSQPYFFLMMLTSF